MSDFSQNGIITTLHDFGTKSTKQIEAELLNFCLAPAYQGQGLAREFLVQVLADMTDQGSESVFLEVRESNEAAIRLYLGCGFCEIGRRKAYYPHEQGREDALLLMRSTRL